MFIPQPKNLKPSPLDLTITQALSDMQSLDPGTKEYTAAVASVKTLTQLKEHDAPKKVNPDVLVTAGANLLGILLILHYERINVIGSKALSFVMKLK